MVFDQSVEQLWRRVAEVFAEFVETLDPEAVDRDGLVVHRNRFSVRLDSLVFWEQFGISDPVGNEVFIGRF
ncbi:hypothetical protein GCM10009647_052190 [Streptomyces sanglieri]